MKVLPVVRSGGELDDYREVVVCVAPDAATAQAWATRATAHLRRRPEWDWGTGDEDDWARQEQAHRRAVTRWAKASPDLTLLDADHDDRECVNGYRVGEPLLMLEPHASAEASTTSMSRPTDAGEATR